MHHRAHRLAALALALAAAPATGCFDAGATNVEMRAAVNEAVSQGQAQAVENEIVEITTSFTIGAGLQEIAQEIHDFAQSQVPCSTVTVDAATNTVTIDFGELGDACVYNGHTYAGVVTVTVEDEGGAVVVDHTYAELTNGEVTLSGTKKVTWEDQSRRIVSDFEITRDGATIDATSDRLQTLLDPAAGLAGGIEINGQRHWVGAKGEWDLQIDGVEVRWQDPVPQAGTYTLENPQDKAITMSFARLDEDTIEVTVDGGRRSRIYHVTAAGAVDDVGEG
ncbi:MAG TPA: hypothetical protein PKW35_09410 [Nannocystaceae bacterium]|nr:hypothetical protein [Nannocystaceae bacterium]